MKKAIKVLMYVYRSRNGRREFFVLYRKKGDAVVLTGHVRDVVKDESLEQAAKREIKEELGVEIKNIINLNISTIVKIKEKENNILSTEHAFLIEIPDKNVRFLEGDEEHKWHPLEELSKVLTYPNQKEPLRKIINIIKTKKASLKDLEIIYNFNVDLAKHEIRFDSVRKWPKKKKHYHRGYEDLRKKLKKRDCRFFIAEDKGKPIGFIEGCVKKTPPFYKYSRRGEIGPTFVIKEYRKKNIGRELAKEMLGWFKSKDINWVQLTTHAENINSINFWKKLGFKEYSIRMNLLLK